MAPRLDIPMNAGSRKGTQLYYYIYIYIYTFNYLLYTISFLSKVPANKPPPGSPAGPLRREILVYGAFCITLKEKT